MRESAIKCLVLYADYTTRLSYYDDWLDAFTRAPGFAVQAVNICGRPAGEAVRRGLADAELVVLLHSTNGDTTGYLEPLVPLLADRRSMLLGFVGNEVNLPGSPIAAKRDLFAQIAPDFIATQLPLEAGEFLFGDVVGRRVLAVPHALNPEAFRSTVVQADRPVDIGVRSVRYLPHLGDEDRNRLYDYFARQPFPAAFKADIGTQRLGRADWAAFLNRCKGTISTEAGSWYLERDDRTVEAIRAWTAERVRGKLVIANDSPLRRIGHKLPWWMRAALRRVLSRGIVRHESTVAEEIPFDEVYDRFFRDYERPAIYGKCISSRHFDAIGTRTCQIMFPGRFNDILTADEHYIALAPDLSNIDDVMERFNDVSYRTAIAERAYEHVMAGHCYTHRIAFIHDSVSAGAMERAAPRAMRNGETGASLPG